MAEKARGRGALLEMLKKHKEAKVGSGEPSAEELPPKSRGRAALLEKIQMMKEKKVGSNVESTPPVSSIPGPSSSGTRDVDVTKAMSELAVSSTLEPVSYKGQAGTPLRATANYIFLEVEKDRGMFEYEVRFQPDLDARAYRRKLVGGIIRQHATSAVASCFTYDGDVFLYLPSQLFTDRTEFDSVVPNTDQPVKVILIYKRKRKMHECLHMYNVLFKKIMHILLYNRIGRNYFSPNHKHVIPQHKLEVLPGFAVTCDEMEGGLMLCLDTQHRVIRSQTAYELMQDLRASNPRTFFSDAKNMLVGSCVLTRYNNQSYIVDDLSSEITPKDTFPARNGTETAFVDYYKQQYNITINDVNQPMIITKKTKTIEGKKQDTMIMLIPELCYMTGLTSAMREDYKVMKDVAAFTRVTPNQRLLAMRTYLQNVQSSEEARQVLAGWGLKLSNRTTDLNARVLPPETIYFGGPQSEARKLVGAADWNRQVGDNPLTGPIDIINWQLFYTKRDQKYAANFAETLVRLSKGMGCIIRNPQHVMLNDDRAETYMTAIKNNVTRDVQVAAFICPTAREDRYSIIKKMCCINHPIASQCMLSKTLGNPQKVRTIIHKIGMQMICKLGGTLWTVKIPASGWMVCGIDVYHGTNKQSVCGFVASINDSMTKYYSEAMFQDGEIGDFFKMAFRKALMQQRDAKGSFPQKVIIFRDGVGDGQLEHSRRYEVSQFLDVIKELNIEVNLTFVVVQKRISTRIFKMIDDRNCENPPAGTVVDSIVTRRNLADFYLVPQSVRQGTVNPTHYIIIHNDGNINPDHLQRLAYKLCHLYYNWSGTIRVPAPCLYAHKLAALIGQFVKKIPSSELNDKLYYL